MLEFSFYAIKTLTEPSKFINWKDLQQTAENPATTAKDNTACIHPSSAPAKKKDAVLQHNNMTLLWADVDSGNISLKELRQRAEDRNIDDYIVYSTASANRLKGDIKQGNRWRVLASLSAGVSCNKWLLLQQAMMQIFSGGNEAVRIQQILFLPTNPDGGYYEHHVKTGTPLESKHLPPKIEILIETIKMEEAKQSEVARNAPLSPRTLDATQSNIIEMVNDAYPLESVLAGLGYTNCGHRLLHPNSSSGRPGVILFNDKYYSHHSLETDSLADGHTHDSFDLLCHWQFNGEVNRTVAHFADELDPEGQKERRIEHVQKQAEVNDTQNNTNAKIPFSLKQFSLSGKSKEMEKQMLDDVFILGRLAILGQSTAFFAKPNAGKTLLVIHLIIEAIKKGNINAADVFYINADDNFKGLIQKLKLAEKHGFEMLSPSHNGFNARDFIPHLVQMITTEECRGKIIVLDTVKKFTDLMNKKISSEFGDVVRQFVSHGGSVIMLAHTNKKRNDDGKVVYAGTSDLTDDADCAYLLDIIPDNETTGLKTVEFENFKSRGAVTSKEVYSYDATDSSDYLAKLGSVRLVDENGKRAIEHQRQLKLMQTKNEEAIDAIKKCLRMGSMLKTELLKVVSANSGISKTKINKALVDHHGENIAELQYWTVTIGEKNAHTYSLNQYTSNWVADSQQDDERSTLPF